MPGPAAPTRRLDATALHEPVLAWYAQHARDLPWRRPDVSAWAVLVSEIMLQQTPVARVLPAYKAWLVRWPTPAALAEAEPGAAVRQWDRLGYPRRALRLHAAARACVERHGGAVPPLLDELLALPGVGRYTAAAVASFAFGQRHAVLDTNVRRVQARAVAGVAQPSVSATAAEWQLAADLVPAEPARAATWAVAVMEVGAIVCTARAPRCDECPIRDRCAWLRAGRPAYSGPGRRAQAYDGTDRQCRGRLLAVLRNTTCPVSRAELADAWADAEQRERALGTLIADGLVEPLTADHYRLPAGR